MGLGVERSVDVGAVKHGSMREPLRKPLGRCTMLLVVPAPVIDGGNAAVF
jgi:hypothetical protein